MKMRASALAILALGAAGLGGCAHSFSVSEATQTCPAIEGFASVCGAIGVEDLVALEDSRWLIGGGLNFGVPARFHAIDTRQLSAKPLAPDLSGPGTQRCPVAPQAAGLSINGLALTQGGSRTGVLYAANHGDRQAVEIFDLDWSDEDSPPVLTWRDCIPLPEGSANGVAVSREGTVAATSFPPVTDAQAWQEMDAGRPAGALFIASPGGSFERIEGLGLSGPNGLSFAEDGTLFISEWGASRLRVLQQNGTRDLIPLDFRPDNISVEPDGSLLLAGQRAIPTQIAACSGPVCKQDWLVALVDPATAKVHELIAHAGTDQVSYAAGATRRESLLFITARSDNRILVAEAPPLPF